MLSVSVCFLHEVETQASYCVCCLGYSVLHCSDVGSILGAEVKTGLTLKECRRRSILKKNHDVTIMTSSGHVTSSITCPIDSPQTLSYTLSIGTIPLSGFVSEIFSPKDY